MTKTINLRYFAGFLKLLELGLEQWDLGQDDF